MEKSNRYNRAKKKVDDIKGFYNHLTVYILVNVVLLVINTPLVIFFSDLSSERTPEEFLDWLDWNIILTPVVWGIGLFIHYIAVFGVTPRFVKKWEKRKIEQYLNEDGNSQKWL